MIPMRTNENYEISMDMVRQKRQSNQIAIFGIKETFPRPKWGCSLSRIPGDMILILS